MADLRHLITRLLTKLGWPLPPAGHGSAAAMAAYTLWLDEIERRIEGLEGRAEIESRDRE